MGRETRESEKKREMTIARLMCTEALTTPYTPSLDMLRGMMAGLGIIPLVMKALDNHVESIPLCRAACNLIGRLCQNDTNRTLLIALGAIEKVASVMEKHQEDVDVVLFSCFALVELNASEDDTTKDDASITATKHEFSTVIDALLKAMRKHRDVADVHRYGAKALENLASRSGQRLWRRGAKRGGWDRGRGEVAGLVRDLGVSSRY